MLRWGLRPYTTCTVRAGTSPAHLAAMTDETTHIDAAAAALASTDEQSSMTNVDVQLRTRVVREARRETWFVVNEGAEDLATIPIALREDASLRRVEVNGEVAEFTADVETVLVRPRMLLRAGAGTIVVLHFR